MSKVTAKRRPNALEALLAGLGAYADLLKVVPSSRSTAGCSHDELRAEFSDLGPRRIEGVLWEDVPPVALTRYDHIIYWLTRRHVWRLPSWVAVQATGDGWPSERGEKLVLADAASNQGRVVTGPANRGRLSQASDGGYRRSRGGST